MLRLSIKVVPCLLVCNNANSLRHNRQVEEMVSEVLSCSKTSWPCGPCPAYLTGMIESRTLHMLGLLGVRSIPLLQMGPPFRTIPQKPPRWGPSSPCLWFKRDLCRGQAGRNFQASLIAASPNEDAMLTHIFIL